jgi:GT2 family glycosyltransferase
MEALVICSRDSNKSLDVLMASLEAYDFPVPVYISGVHKENTNYTENTATNFGDAYNYAVTEAFKDGYNSILMANDDVVIRPDTYELMLEDWNKLQGMGQKIGFLGARSDWVLNTQNIRYPFDNNDYIINHRFISETYIKEVIEIAPIFAAISREAWEEEQFPPLDWYSDNVICYNLAKKGYHHFTSRGYVHHIGAHSVDLNPKLQMDKAESWMKANAPELYQHYYIDEPKQNEEMKKKLGII